MVISLRKWIRWVKRFVLLIVCIYFFYQIIHWVVFSFFPDSWKNRPGDGAVKVITLGESSSQDWTDGIRYRLYYFYLTGE